ncbi:MAG: cupredoxin domain-containing protein [Bdellovibrionota bacterium]
MAKPRKSLAALVAGLVLLAGSLSASAKDIQVKIEGMSFVPKNIQAKVGDTITWTNQDILPHTVTDLKKSKPLMNSGTLLPGASFQFKVLRSGNIHYGCLLHPTMSAQIHAGK